MQRFSMLRGAAFFALATAAAGAAYAQTTPTPPPVQTTWSGAPQTQQGEQRFKIRGRIQYDLIDVETDFTGVASDFDYTRSATRRARLGVEGRFSDEWRYRAEFTLLGDVDNSTTQDEVQFEDVYVEYAGSFFSIVLGNNKVIAPLEEITSSRFITFNERSGLINAFGFGRQLGAAILFSGANWSAGAGFYGDSPNNPEAQVDESTTGIARLTFAPIFEQSPEGLHLLHLGATARYRDNGGDGAFRYRTRPAALGFGNRFIDTNTLAQQDTFLGGEVAYVYGPFSVQGEYAWSEANLTAGGQAEMDSYYADLIWNITGESRAYRSSDGSFQRQPVARPVGEGGIGAVQIAARYEVTDLTEVSATSGEQEAYTVGLHWYPYAYVGFKLNYGHSEVEDGPVGDGEANVVSLRTQFDW